MQVVTKASAKVITLGLSILLCSMVLVYCNGPAVLLALYHPLLPFPMAGQAQEYEWRRTQKNKICQEFNHTRGMINRQTLNYHMLFNRHYKVGVCAPTVKS